MIVLFKMTFPETFPKFLEDLKKILETGMFPKCTENFPTFYNSI